MMHPVMRLMVDVRALTGAGSTGLTRLPSGRCNEIGRKQPALVGIAGSVRARMAKQAAAKDPDGTQFIGPRTCGDVPVKSIWIPDWPMVTATSMRMGLSSSMPSLSR